MLLNQLSRALYEIRSTQKTNLYILARVTSGWHSTLPECLMLKIYSNFLIALITIFLHLSSANPASYTGIETLTSSWLLNNIWVEEGLNSNLNLLQRKFRRKQGKILNRKIYSQEVSNLDFNGTLFYSLKGSQCLYHKAEQTLNTAFDTAKFIVLSIPWRWKT